MNVVRCIWYELMGKIVLLLFGDSYREIYKKSEKKNKLERLGREDGGRN